MDDILIFSNSKQEHVLHIHRVLQRLLENQLFVQAEKWEFHASEVFLLEFVVNPGNIRMYQAKTRVVTDWPAPPTRNELKCLWVSQTSTDGSSETTVQWQLLSPPSPP